MKYLLILALFLFPAFIGAQVTEKDIAFTGQSVEGVKFLILKKDVAYAKGVVTFTGISMSSSDDYEIALIKVPCAATNDTFYILKAKGFTDGAAYNDEPLLPYERKIKVGSIMWHIRETLCSLGDGIQG